LMISSFLGYFWTGKITEVGFPRCVSEIILNAGINGSRVFPLLGRLNDRH